MVDDLPCPVCDTNSSSFCSHPYFKGNHLYRCLNCDHGWVNKPDPYSHPFVTGEKGGRRRAKRNVGYLVKSMSVEPILSKINSLWEIGPASDFYFIRQVYKYLPDTKLYVYDIVDYSKKVPEYVTFCHSMDESLKVDLIYSCHSLEHLPDINDFMRKATMMASYLLIEVPVKDGGFWWSLERASDKKIIAGVGSHHQVFSSQSINKLFEKYGVEELDFCVHGRSYRYLLRVGDAK